MRISIGIMAFNEEKNIARLLDSIFTQKLKNITIAEIIVISSGSTDKTNKIIKQYIKQKSVDIRFERLGMSGFSLSEIRRNPLGAKNVASKTLLSLIVQPKRKGKASAVNLFIQKAKSPIIVLTSADLLLEKNTLQELLKPFTNTHVGMTGVHPIPVNNPNRFFGYAAHLLWNLHHQISLHKPKMGEMVAFRKVFKKIPILSAVDEANIEPLVRGQGYKIVYAKDALVRNKGPENLHEFIAARRRVYAGHLAAKYEYSYEVSTLKGLSIFQLLLKQHSWNWKFFIWTPLVIFLEIYSRLLGYLDYTYKLKNHAVWEVTKSTKKL